MAESQLLCLDEQTVHEKVLENQASFYYSEPQRAALEELLRDGDGAFKARLEEDGAKDFLSARELKWIRETFREYEAHGGEKPAAARSPGGPGGRSTYWPQTSDAEVPPLDMGWADLGRYRGVSRVKVYTHPPREREPLIREVVRRLIQESRKLLAVVMDLLTDLHILQDLLDAASERRVPVYVVLDGRNMPHFLDMCTRLVIKAAHLQNLRVRTVAGLGMALTQGKLPGCLCKNYMLVDGDKVMFGSYSFTWSSSRLNRTMITVMTGQVVDFFDQDFRELYAISEEVNLYQEFHIAKPPVAASSRLAVNPRPPSLSSTTRFQVSLGDPRQINPQVPAHKYHNPKYLLALGGPLGPLGSPEDPLKGKEQQDIGSSNLILQKFLQSTNEEQDDVTLLPDDVTSTPEVSAPVSKKTVGSSNKKHRSSLKFLVRRRTPKSATAASPIANLQETRPGAQESEQPLPSKAKDRKLSQKSASSAEVSMCRDDGSKEPRKSPKSKCTVS